MRLRDNAKAVVSRAGLGQAVLLHIVAFISFKDRPSKTRTVLLHRQCFNCTAASKHIVDASLTGEQSPTFKEASNLKYRLTDAQKQLSTAERLPTTAQGDSKREQCDGDQFGIGKKISRCQDAFHALELENPYGHLPAEGVLDSWKKFVQVGPTLKSIRIVTLLMIFVGGTAFRTDLPKRRIAGRSIIEHIASLTSHRFP
ncbi:hypothetical protein M513_00401 [Trichuris suis]|uniref:Uncharacterized protein n=1 Tax=Trichuris suis TaxID=68888 RepID=A0A085MNB2_9BILA|nr:hypothetical protein M513_00401 [Trichuris suis]